eukprot:364327-Chlamydomonas_euryale.AAC.12
MQRVTCHALHAACGMHHAPGQESHNESRVTPLRCIDYMQHTFLVLAAVAIKTTRAGFGAQAGVCIFQNVEYACTSRPLMDLAAKYWCSSECCTAYTMHLTLWPCTSGVEGSMYTHFGVSY